MKDPVIFNVLSAPVTIYRSDKQPKVEVSVNLCEGMSKEKKAQRLTKNKLSDVWWTIETEIWRTHAPFSIGQKEAHAPGILTQFFMLASNVGLLLTMTPSPLFSGNNELSTLVRTLDTPLLSASQRLNLLAAFNSVSSNDKFSKEVVTSLFFVLEKGLKRRALLPKHPVALLKFSKVTLEIRFPPLNIHTCTPKRKRGPVRELNHEETEIRFFLATYQAGSIPLTDNSIPYKPADVP